MTTENISKKVTVLSFCAMLSVVLIHSTSLLTVEHPARWNLFCQYLITRSFTYWAVPFFFLMSGYWFAKSDYVSRGGVKTFLLKKFRTLFVPYVLWAMIGGLLCLPLIVGNNYITHRPLLERTFLNADSLGQSVDLLFAITRPEPMGNGPLWYVRSLLILFAFAPLWRLLIRVKFGWVVLLALGLTETKIYPMNVDFLGVYSMAIGWFAFGMSVASRGWDEIKVSRSVVASAGVVWLVASLTKSLHMAGIDFCPPAIYRHVVALIPFGGILFMWGLYDYTDLSTVKVRPFFRETFWVYCIHGPLIGCMMGIGKFLLGKSDGATILVMFISFGFTLAGCYWLSRLLKAMNPVIYRVLTGGRG